ncbi:MAG: hypothetical protein AMS22_03915 [Thiotrichales bacterium SG8_50]|jgi:hypothetical protein|nr:MAG: hypothetical protein AMS22_03915 [Thiotrichales bacterium SG8_50]
MFSMKLIGLARYMPKGAGARKASPMRSVWIVLALAMTPWLVWSGEAGASAGDGAVSATAAVGTPKGRLKYRGKGPVCVCSTGLSEREIQDAERARTGAGAVQGAETKKADSPQQTKEQKK